MFCFVDQFHRLCLPHGHLRLALIEDVALCIQVKLLLSKLLLSRIYLLRARIFLRLRWRRRVRFFFHFQRIFDVDFL